MLAGVGRFAPHERDAAGFGAVRLGMLDTGLLGCLGGLGLRLRHRSHGTLTVDGNVVSTQKMERTVPLILPVDETFDVGSKTGTPVDDRDYQIPFTFTGKINKVTISVEPPKLTAEDEKKLADAYRAAQDAK